MTLSMPHFNEKKKAVSIASCDNYISTAARISRRCAPALPRPVGLVLIVTIIHFIITMSQLYNSEMDVEVFGYQLPLDIERTLAAIRSGEINTAPINSSNLLPPFLRYVEVFETSPRYQLSVCMIPKVMSTLTMSIFCYLKNPVRFKADGRRISTERWHASFCKERDVIRNYSQAEELLGLTRLVFIRDPIDRFLSGFVNKCILKGLNETVEYCFDCHSDLNCFVEAFREELWTIYERSGRQRSPIGYHLAPLTWNCNFKDHLHDYIFLRHANGTSGVQFMAMELYRILERAGVPKSQLEDIKNAVLVGKSPHSTSSSIDRAEAERQLYGNKTLLKTVIELYYYDFLIFGYSIPSLE